MDGTNWQPCSIMPGFAAIRDSDKGSKWGGGGGGG